MRVDVGITVGNGVGLVRGIHNVETDEGLTETINSLEGPFRLFILNLYILLIIIINFWDFCCVCEG